MVASPSSPTLSPAHTPRTVMLAEAVTAYLPEVDEHRRDRVAALLASLDRHLGHPAPLLAYTRLTGEGWRRSLTVDDQAAAAFLLAAFRAFLRDEGWLDRARPLNLPD